MNPSSRITVESLVVPDKERKAIVERAIFEASEVEGQIWLFLDLAPTEPDTHSVRFHPREQDLTKIAESPCEIVYRHKGNPIEVWDYIQLPKERRGFRLVENWPHDA